MAVDPSDHVILVVPIEARQFSADATLVVQVWNARQLAALEENRGCSVGHDSATGATQTTCPPGVVFREVSPERFEFPVRTVGTRLEVTPTGVGAGETFRIRVSGRSRDGCNTTFGDETLTARPGGRIQVGLSWESTAKACGKGDP